jgi:hypothetical protein
MTPGGGAIPAARAEAGPRRLALVFTLAGLAAALVMGAVSNGVYHDDDICHYLYARDSWGDAQTMLHWWARPGYNVPTMFVARLFGVAGCRVFSALQTAAVAYLAFLIARRVGVKGLWAALAPAIVWLQPLTFTLAMTTLTETPAALYLALGAWLYLKGRRTWACVALSPAFVTRIETLALAPIAAGALLADALRRTGWRPGEALRTPWLWHGASALLWAPAAWALAAWALNVPPEDSPVYVLFRPHTQEYGSDPWYHYLMEWPHMAGLGVVALALGGCVCLGRRAWMVSALGLGLLVLHGTLRTLGAFATGGYGRFLVPAAAFYAVLAAGGARCLWEARSRAAVIAAAAAAPALLALTAYAHPWVISAEARQAHVLAWGVAAVAAPVVLAAALAGREGTKRRKLLARAGQLAAGGLAAVTLVQVAFQVHPLMLSSNPDGAHLAVNEAVEWVAASEYRDAPAITQHVMIRFLRGEKKTHRVGTNEEAIKQWMDAEPGAIFFWESKYCFKRKLPTAEQEAAGVEPPPTASTLELYRKLREWGKRLWRLDFRGVVIEVYVRAAEWQGPASGGPEAPTTRPAYPLQ